MFDALGEPGDSSPQIDPGNGRLDGHAILAKLTWSLVSEPGNVRPHNEDFAGIYAPTIPDDAWPYSPLFVVADGMGGHAAGEVASRLAVTTMLEHWHNDPVGLPIPKKLRMALRAANTTVLNAALETPAQRKMGTTLIGLTIANREATIVHVGDSRAYLVREDRCTQLTNDHSRTGEMLRAGLIKPEQAPNHPYRSMLTNSIGCGALTVNPDIVKQPLAIGDVLVLCTDGLWDKVSRSDIAEVIGRIGGDIPTAADAAQALTDLAVKRNTLDNATAVVVQISKLPILGSGSPDERHLFRRRGKIG